MTNPFDEKTFQCMILSRLEAAGYDVRPASAYDDRVAMDRDMLISFVKRTQPEKWDGILKRYEGDIGAASEYVVSSVNAAITSESGGLIRTLKHGVKLTPLVTLDLMYMKPANDYNDETMRLYRENKFSVMEEVYADGDSRVDLVIFLNGIAIVTLELKSNPSGQSVDDAIKQYRETRSRDTRLFRFDAGALVHFAMDFYLVFMTTRLDGEKTRFIPFNRGRGTGIDAGAGNEIGDDGFGTSYMWEDILKPDTMIELISRYVFVENGDGEKDERKLIFPRYHQYDCVRQATRDAEAHGAGKRYLIAHSAGSGKTNTIAWLAYSFTSLHRVEGGSSRVVFDKVVITTDRLIVDRQLQDAILGVDHKEGLVLPMDDRCTSSDLRRALEGEVKIVVTTIQKFPYIADEVRQMRDKKFAVLIDEAHSSTTGKDMLAVMRSLGIRSDGDDDIDVDEAIGKTIDAMSEQDNVSFFAFTATPKPETMHCFGNPFHGYSMKQAIEEGFILDVLKNYMTYHTFFTTIKTAAENPLYKTREAQQILLRLAMRSPENIKERTAIIVEHFRAMVKGALDGHAKAMVVTASREEAVLYKQEFDEYVREHHYSGMKALVAFTGTVTIKGNAAALEREHTEAEMNGFPDTRTASEFDKDEYRWLFVANKFQTGFDQPKLCAMYVMKKLKGVNAVQTLSRLNRICPPHDKQTFIVDFENSYDDIRKAFAPYYTETVLAGEIDKDALDRLLEKIREYGVVDDGDVESYDVVLREAHYHDAELSEYQREALLRYIGATRNSILELAEASQHAVVSLMRRYTRFYELLNTIFSIKDGEKRKYYVYMSALLPMMKLKKRDLSKLKDEVVFVDFVNEKQGEYGPTGEPVSPEPVPLRPVKVTTGVVTRGEESAAALSEIVKEFNLRNSKDYDESVIYDAAHDIEDDIASDEDVADVAMNNSIDDFRTYVNDRIVKILADRTVTGSIASDSETMQLYKDLLNEADKTAIERFSSIIAGDIYRGIVEGEHSRDDELEK